LGSEGSAKDGELPISLVLLASSQKHALCLKIPRKKLLIGTVWLEYNSIVTVADQHPTFKWIKNDKFFHLFHTTSTLNLKMRLQCVHVLIDGENDEIVVGHHIFEKIYTLKNSRKLSSNSLLIQHTPSVTLYKQKCTF
jgi:hypothetical protein